MTTSALTRTPGSAHDRPHALRVLLVVTAVVVLFAIAFTVGHLTAGSSASAVSGQADVLAPSSGIADISSHCQAGHVRGPC
jgi:hypothetical protein